MRVVERDGGIGGEPRLAMLRWLAAVESHPDLVLLVSRRKALLAEPRPSVADIGLIYNQTVDCIEDLRGDRTWANALDVDP